MIRIFTRLGQNIDDQLSNCDGALNSLQFGVVWLCDNGVQPLIMEVYENRIHALEDAMDRAVVKVQKSKRAPVAHLAFNVRHVQHACDIQDVGVKVDAVQAVGHILRQVCEISVPDKFLDFDVFWGQFLIFAKCDPLGSFFFPCARSHAKRFLFWSEACC